LTVRRKAVPKLVREALEKKGFYRLSRQELIERRKEFLEHMRAEGKASDLREAYEVHRGRGYSDDSDS